MKRIFHLSAICAVSCVLYCVCIVSVTYAANIPTGQDVGSLGRTVTDTERKQAVSDALIKGKDEPAIDEDKMAPAEEAVLPSGMPDSTVLITRINVTGVTALNEEDIRAIIAPFEGRELSLKELQDVVGLITDEYRAKGYITSIAYLPPQKIENNVVEIAVAEGKVGNIGVSGQKHFTEKQLTKYLDLKKGDLFNYDILRSNVTTMNAHPDRNARVVLERGAARQETDINVQVEDRQTLHATLGYSNYNSRYLERNKFSVELKSTNFLKLDHVASIEAQLGEGGLYELYSARYVMPIGSRSKLGGYYISLDQELGRDVTTSEIRGEGDIFSLYYSRKLIDREDLALNINPGFEYKDIKNTVLGVSAGEDDMRIAKLGLDLDFNDRWNGRTIITHEFDFGIKDILGGLSDNDLQASRTGAGGNFFRTVTNAAHIHPLPKNTALMIRGAAQLTSDTLVSSEQFHIGGATTVRGYPVSEHAGDYGCTLSAELYIPPFFLPKDKKVPFDETTWYDALRLLGFIDYGYVGNNDPASGESKHEEIYSVGPAVRFDVPGKYSVTFDYGFALGQDASDGSESRGYVEVKMYF